MGCVCFSFKSDFDCKNRFLAALRFSSKNCFDENHPNQCEHRIHRVVVIGGICHLLHPKPCGPLNVPLHISLMIFRFFLQPDSLGI